MTTDLHALAAAYSLDALDPDERAEFEAHLATCAECQADVAEFGATAAFLADASLTAPPADLKATIMAEVARTPQEQPPESDSADATIGSVPVVGADLPPPTAATPVTDLSARRRRRFTPTTLLATAAAFALFAVGAVALVSLRDSGGSSEVASVLEADDVRIVALETQIEGTPGSVQVAWSPSRDEIALIANGVADPDEGLLYALWAIADGVPVPAGLFDPDDGTIREVGDVDDVQAVAFGITIEPEAGSPQPTSDILFLGNV